jgi:hypothetical protein
MMFFPLIGKELAPFQHAHVDKIAVGQSPEISACGPFLVEKWPVFLTLSDPIIRKIPCKVATKYHYTPESVSWGHLETFCHGAAGNLGSPPYVRLDLHFGVSPAEGLVDGRKAKQ